MLFVDRPERIEHQPSPVGILGRHPERSLASHAFAVSPTTRDLGLSRLGDKVWHWYVHAPGSNGCSVMGSSAKMRKERLTWLC